MNKQLLFSPGQTITFLVEYQNQKLRLDSFLHLMLPDYSRNFLQQLIHEHYVAINNKKTQKNSTLLKMGDSITITFLEKDKSSLSFSQEELAKIDAKVLFQNNNFAIIYKSAGLIVHANHAKMTVPTLVEWLAYTFPNIGSVGCLDRPGIIHRLDKNTSGLMIIALTNPAFAIFSKLFHDRHIHKTYLAIVKGHPEKKGTFSDAIARHPTVRNKMTTHTNGRSAQTNFTVLEYFKETSLVEVKPVTGRTHQIRVHFAKAGHPLIGDELYGSNSPLIARHALHAYKLAFEYQGKNYEFESEQPEDFKNLLKIIATQ